MPTINFSLTAQIVLQTCVSSQGTSSNNVATINIIDSGTIVWSGVMIQSAPQIVTPFIKMGTVSIEAGSTFNLTVPSTLMNGNVISNIDYTTPPNPTTAFNGQIASWSLTAT
jgi:hypothetical protein